ncbi:MAG: hypothetical protein IIY46_09790 [Lachnospiraceae bacterium]|nr:hypothetical protein [Lachnospiraceae bacterium]
MSRNVGVIQYDLSGRELCRYASVREAQLIYGITHISSVCRGQRNKDGGFIWRYADDAGEKKEVPAPKEKAKTARS